MAWVNLGKILDQKGWSQRRFAQELGVSPQAVSKYFEPGYEPGLINLLWWCEVLDCTLGELIDEELEPGQIPVPSSTNRQREVLAKPKNPNERHTWSRLKKLRSKDG